MKKNSLIVLMGFTLILTVSCKKSQTTSSPEPIPNNDPVGQWQGTYDFAGNPSRYFFLYLNAGGTLVVNANSNMAPTVGNGNWSLVADSVKGSFNFTTGSILGTISFAGKYSTSSLNMIGTLGYGVSTAGAGTFSVTKIR